MLSSVKSAPRHGTVAVSALNLTKTFGRGNSAVHALNGISINLRRNELTLVTGTPGAGKTTLINCLAGMDKITGGRVFIAGQEISQLRGRALFRATAGRVSMVSSQPRLLPEWSVLQNILLPLDLTDGCADHDHLHRVIEALGLKSLLARPAQELSDLHQQRVALARAAIVAPEVILVDTVWGASDQATDDDLPLALRALCRDLDQTVVLAARRPNPFADRTLTLDRGVLIDDKS